MKAPCGACATCEQCPYDDCTWDDVSAEEWAAAKDTDADARHAVESKKAAQKRAWYEANREKVADLLGVSKSTVLRMIRAGEFGQTVNVARQHLVTEDGLGEFIAAHTGPPTTNKSRTKKPRRGAADRNPGPI